MNITQLSKTNTDMVTLRTGTVEVAALVSVITMTLRTLLEENPITFYEAVELARNPHHKVWGASKDELRGLGLCDDADVDASNDMFMHSSTRDIILASVEGEGTEMRLVNPISTK